jgi:hypothetical protein
MRILFFCLLIVAGFYPLALAWQSNRQTSLRHAVCWAVVAWLAWGLLIVVTDKTDGSLRYLALCMTAAAGIAVLGARRPHVAAWDVVVAGLLAVMLLPLAENLFLGTPVLAGLRVIFLGAALAVAVLNYAPTCFAVPAWLVAVICSGEFLAFAGVDAIGPSLLDGLHLGMLVVPWLGLACWKYRRFHRSVIDQLWHDFRDSFGLFWGLRVRDQYNRSAANAGWPGFLTWRGWEQGKDPSPTADQEKEMQALFIALCKRFVDENM